MALDQSALLDVPDALETAETVYQALVAADPTDTPSCAPRVRSTSSSWTAASGVPPQTRCEDGTIR